MQRMICIPKERYLKMVESYDQAIEEIERLKKALKETATSERASNQATHQKSRILF